MVRFSGNMGRSGHIGTAEYWCPTNIARKNATSVNDWYAIDFRCGKRRSTKLDATVAIFYKLRCEYMFVAERPLIRYKNGSGCSFNV